MALPTMSLDEAKAFFRGTWLEGSENLYNYRLPPRGYSPETDRALDMVAQGVSPENIRELDAWTGAVHFEYKLPGGPTGNVNIWILDQATQTWRYRLPNGQELTIEQASQYPNIPPPPALDASGNWRPRVVTPPEPEPEPRSLPPQATRTVETPPLQPTGGNIHVADTSIVGQLRALAVSNMGTDKLNWDQWNYYYAQLTGENGPAPEDRGFQRSADGSVVIDGAAVYTVETWWRHAFPGNPLGAAPGQAPSGGGVSQERNLVATLLAFIAKLLAWFVSGAGRGASA